MIKIAFTTLGCKTNFYDSELMAALCRKAGFQTVRGNTHTDVHVINTCTVTSSADAQSRNIIRRLIRFHPSSLIVICGCSSQINPKQFQAIEGVHHVLGVEAGPDLIRILNENYGINLKAKAHFSMNQSRARAFLKVQDGCNQKCAYCLISKARGASRSLPVSEVLRERNSLIKEGFKEIILTGVHIGYYGKDLNPPSSLASLLDKLTQGIDSCRFRVSSLNPYELDEQMISLFSHPQICSHLHLSLQSGCDEILERMNRKTGVESYLKNIKNLKSKVPDIAIGADIIVGFPGETQDNYNQTLYFVRNAPITYLHVFPFSPRPGTKAYKMADQVPEAIRKKRMREMKAVSLEKRRAFFDSQLGRDLEIVVVSKRPNKDGLIKGISHNYIPVYVKDAKAKYREIICIKAEKLLPGEEGVLASKVR